MKQSGIVTCCVAALILVFCIPTQGQTIHPNRERAKALWEEAIEAKGGRERLHSIESFLISSTVDVWSQRERERAMLAQTGRDQFHSNPNVPTFRTGDAANQIGSGETQTERLYVGPGKAWIYTYTPGVGLSLDATVINRNRNRCWMTLGPVTLTRAANGVPFLSRCLPETPIQYLVQDPVLYLMETKWIQPEPIGVRTEGKGKNQLDVIETKVGMMRIDFYLDRKTRLPIKIVTDWYGGLTQATGHQGPMTIELRKYVEIDGIQMPAKVTRELDGNGRGPVGEPYRLDTERAAYKFNVAYNPDIFETPVPKTVKRRDWKME